MKPANSVQFWRPAELEGLEIVHIRESAHVFPRHSHDYYAIGCMERGASYCLSRADEASCVYSGGVALINPGQVHTGGSPQGRPISYRMFYVDPDWMLLAARDVAENIGGCPEFSRIVASDGQAWTLLRHLAITAVGAGGLLAKQSAMLGAFAVLLTGHACVRPAVATPGSEPRAVRIARELLAADLDVGLSLDELALAAGLSRYHLLRVFKKAVGLPPHAYRTQLRIERAKALMRSGRSLADTAAACGFADQAHFANRFRQFTGATPGQYLSA